MSHPPLSPVLSEDLALSCLDRFGQPLEVTTSFGYDPTDPFAVSLTFRPGGTPVQWLIARTLLLQGLSSPSGEGDVQIYPSIDEDAHAVVILDFNSPDGRLVAQANSQAVYTFLSRTFATVPLGSEMAHLDMDALIASLSA